MFKRIMTLAAGVLITFFVISCEEKAEKSTQVTNSNFKVELLFTDENGCKVYRFADAGNYRYYVVGPGAKGTVDVRVQSTGKTTTTVDRSIPTVAN